ncbi:MAG: hypothetical protein ACQETX_12195 [Pseudomonadota bacterium]
MMRSTMPKARENWNRGLLLALLLLFAIFNVNTSTAQSDRAQQSQSSTPDFAESFLDQRGYELQSVASVRDAFYSLLESDTGSVTLPDRNLHAMVKALLALEAVEDTLPRTRFRISRRINPVEMPPAADPVPVSFIEIDRFNLGPGLHEELAKAYGADNVAEASFFGQGPHVSWRFVLRPEMGTKAMIVAAARKELSSEGAQQSECFNAPCLSTTGLVEPAASWSELQEDSPALDAPYELLRDGILTPAFALELLVKNLMVETPAHPSAGAASVEAIVETGLGQDASLDATVVERNLMDDSLRAAWNRLATVSAGSDMDPVIFTAKAFQCARGEAEFAPPGSFCP